MTRRCQWLVLLVMVAPVESRGDGGVVRLSEKRGDYLVTVFTAPNPLRAGPVDLSVLVQDATSKQPIDGLRLRLSPAPKSRWFPAQSLTKTASTNKLFYSAKFDLPESGQFRFRLELQSEHDNATIEFDTYAADPLPRWLELWPWIFAPLVPTFFYLVHQLRKFRAASLKSSCDRR